jgi:hypothetical protein
MRPAGQHALDTGKAYINALKAARQDYQTASHTYYQRFIQGAEKPTATDVDHFKALVIEMETLARFIHIDIEKAGQGFGGNQDAVIRQEKEGLAAMVKKAHG